MARLDGKQIQIGTPTDGDYGTNSIAYGLTSSQNLPDALDALASNISQVAASASMTITDYNTGASYSGIQNIIFRGGIVNTPQFGGVTASATLVSGGSPTVTVWIPAPEYVGYLTPTMGALPAGTSRYISTPDTNSYTASVVSGEFSTNTWVPATDFTGNISRGSTNTTSSFTFTAVQQTATYFACYNLSTTMDFILYSNGATISSILGHPVNAISTTASGYVTLNVTAFTADADRYKAKITGSIDPTIFYSANGGFTDLTNLTFKIKHYNGDGPGNDGAGIYSYTASAGTLFYDNDVTPSSANISGTTTHAEGTPTLRYYSGVAYYNIGSTFNFQSTGINMLNDITLPLSKQTEFTATNFAITGTLDGYADGKKAYGSAITGWSLLWNNSGLTFSKVGTVNQTAQYIPNFASGNTVGTTPTSYVTDRLYDWALVTSSTSSATSYLFDTLSPSAVAYNNNTIESESGRITMASILSNGAVGFTSSQVLPSDELQYAFGRVIYPQQNFNTFYPSANTAVDYSALSGANKTFDVYTDINLATTTPLTFTDYRWFVTSYGKDSGYTTAFSNGIFTLNSNFTESVLDWNAVLGSAGTNDLVILVGVDSSGTNTKPDKFLYVSGDPATYKTRQDPTTYNLNIGTPSSKTIQWSKGTLSFPVKKVWLMIAYKNSATGKTLNITNIAFA